MLGFILHTAFFPLFMASKDMDPLWPVHLRPGNMINLLFSTALIPTQKMRTLLFLISQQVVNLMRVLKLLNLWQF